MSQLLLVNPRAKKRNPRKRRSAAQVAATRKLVALNKARKRVTRRARTATKSAVTTVRRRTRRAASTVKRRYRSYGRSNNLGRLDLVGTAKDGLIGGGGALLIDLIWSKIPVPQMLQSGYGRVLGRAALAVGFGMLAGKVINKSMAQKMAAGAITVQSYELIKSLVGSRIGLAAYQDINGMGYYSPAQVPDYTLSDSTSMGAYLSGVGEGIYDNGAVSAYDEQFVY